MVNTIFAFASADLGVSEFTVKLVLTSASLIVIGIPLLLVLFSQQTGFKNEFLKAR